MALFIRDSLYTYKLCRTVLEVDVTPVFEADVSVLSQRTLTIHRLICESHHTYQTGQPQIDFSNDSSAACCTIFFNAD